MTTNTTSNQWLRTTNPAFTKPVIPPKLPETKPVPRSYPRNGLPGAPSHSNSDCEPLMKRQKLDNERNKPRAEAQNDIAVYGTTSTANASTNYKAGDMSKEGMHLSSTSNSGSAKQKASGSGPPLLPLRPCSKSATNVLKRADLAAAQRHTSRGAVQNKPYTVEPPSSAPRLKSDACADFHPWTGHHHEDILNESTTKNGSYDKPQVSQNETSTAKNAIWSGLKHKSGNQILSSLFVAALDRRQAHGVVTANCTFKPPPRVTLTDTKRETWLRDLANPDIPLRRLSRTIPHGIRGKVLLDQCLAKSIPTFRAVWLAKCVGANEIRAFKRKGAGGAFAVGGESKWIKDWTLSVEQFIESIIGMCGSLDWKSRIDYGLRLASHLSSEHLLDQDHYLSWILSSLQSCDLDTVPVWLLVMRIHLDELLQQRQRGRRLVEALLAQLHKASDASDDQVYRPVVQELVKSLKSLMVSHPKWFVMPGQWHKYESTLREHVEGKGEEPTLKTCFERIHENNQRLLSNALDHQGWRPPDTAEQRLIAIFDTAPCNVDFFRLTNDCLHVTSDLDLLVATCLEWASSPHREGDERIYLSTRLLRHCSRLRGGLDESVMKFLAAKASLRSFPTDRLYRLIAELIRSKHLAPGRYLSWLMARGQLDNDSNRDLDRLCDARLLLEMPSHSVPTHVLNLRQNLMTRIGASVGDEDDAIAYFKIQIRRTVPRLFPPVEEGTDPRSPPFHIRESSVAVRHAISSWIRQTIIARFSYERAKESQTPTISGVQEASGAATEALTLTDFMSIREFLEDIGDFAILADVLHCMTDSEDDTTLAAVADTVSYHFNVFAAIGAHASLFHDVFQQYEVIRQQKNVGLALLESLIDLGKCIPKAAREVKHLKQQALPCQQSSSVTAFSPISDTMAEALQSAESTFAEDIEQVFASGSSMDRQTLGQLFSTITKRLEASWSNQDPAQAGFCEFLTRLRRFGSKDFDGFYADWIRQTLSTAARPGLNEVFLPLICNGCLTLARVLDLAARALEICDPIVAPAGLALDVIEMLSLISTNKALTKDQKFHRCRLQYGRCVRRHPQTFIPFFRTVSQSCSVLERPMLKRARAVFRQPGTRILVNDLATYEPQALLDLGRVLETHAILDNEGHGTKDDRLANRDTESLLKNVLEDIDCFNIPLCRLKLEAALSEAASRFEEPIDMLVTLVQERLPLNAALKTLLPSLFSCLPIDHAIPLRHRMELAILSRLTCDEQRLDDENKELILLLLRIVEANAGVSAAEAMFATVPRIVEKLNALLLCLDSGGISHRFLLHLFEIDVFLRLLAVHQTTIQDPKFPQENVYGILSSLSILLTHPSMTKWPSTTDSIYDILMLMSDSASEDCRTRCISMLEDRHRHQDADLVSIFGLSSSTEEKWLQFTNDALCGPEARHPSTVGSELRLGTRNFSLRRWEMMQDATPFLGDNDARLSLTLFETRKSVL